MRFRVTLNHNNSSVGDVFYTIPNTQEMKKAEKNIIDFCNERLTAVYKAKTQEEQEVIESCLNNEIEKMCSTETAYYFLIAKLIFEPIAWKILKTESDKMLLVTEKPIAQKPFHDEIKKVTWETSYIRMWLNNEFIESFSAEQQNQILSTDTGDASDKVFLFSVDEMVDLAKKEKITFKTSDEWWTRTASEDGIMYATYKGWVKADGDQVVRDKGVRPAIWIDLR